MEHCTQIFTHIKQSKARQKHNFWILNLQSNHTHTAGVDFEGPVDSELTLSQQNPTQQVSIATIDDSDFRGDRVFNVLLEIVSASGEVRLRRSNAAVRILEDEEFREGEKRVFQMYAYMCIYVHYSWASLMWSTVKSF